MPREKLFERFATFQALREAARTAAAASAGNRCRSIPARPEPEILSLEQEHDTWRLRQAMFAAGGWVRSRRHTVPKAPTQETAPSPSLPVQCRRQRARSLAAPLRVPFAAAPGTTMPGTSARPTATGTLPKPGTTTSASVLPARPSAEPDHSRMLRVRRWASRSGHDDLGGSVDLHGGIRPVRPGRMPSFRRRGGEPPLRGNSFAPKCLRLARADV